MNRPLFTPGSANPKTRKGERFDVDTLVLHLAPSTRAGVGDMCPYATAECKAMCLNTAGRGGITTPGERRNAIQKARIRRTRAYVRNPDAFCDELAREIRRGIDRAARRRHWLSIRPNGTSDQPRIATRLADQFAHEAPFLMFYDYTKIPRPYLRQRPNYRLTFSYTGHNAADARDALAHGCNVAVVFSTQRGAPLPVEFLGYPVIDGDAHDLRYLDPIGVIVGLRAKGRAARRARRGTPSAFVVAA